MWGCVRVCAVSIDQFGKQAIRNLVVWLLLERGKGVRRRKMAKYATTARNPRQPVEGHWPVTLAGWLRREKGKKADNGW